MTEKTLFLYDTCGEDCPYFFEKEGNYSHLDMTYVNSYNASEKNIDELLTILYGTSEGANEMIIHKLSAPTKDWTYFVRVGWLP